MALHLWKVVVVVAHGGQIGIMLLLYLQRVCRDQLLLWRPLRLGNLKRGEKEVPALAMQLLLLVVVGVVLRIGLKGKEYLRLLSRRVLLPPLLVQ